MSGMQENLTQDECDDDHQDFFLIWDPYLGFVFGIRI